MGGGEREGWITSITPELSVGELRAGRLEGSAAATSWEASNGKELFVPSLAWERQ